MIEEIDQNLQAFVAANLFVKLAVGFFRFRKAAEFSHDFVHPKQYPCYLFFRVFSMGITRVIIAP